MVNKPDGATLQGILPTPQQLPDPPEQELDALDGEAADEEFPEQDELYEEEAAPPPPPAPDYERQARLMGWHPKEEYLGPPHRWVDAKEFVERGQNILPVLRENNRKLTERIERQTDDLREMRAILNEMRERNKAAEQNGYQRAVADLKRQQREAVANGDTDAYDRIEQKIDEIGKAAAPTPPPPPQPQATQVDPAIKRFVETNPWYTNDRVLNQAMQAEHVRIAEEMPELTLEENLEMASDMVKQRFPQKFGGRVKQPEPPAAPARPRVPSVAAPTGSNRPGPRAHKSAFDQIEDANERAEAKVAFARMKRHMPDYTEEEYMAVYANPKADILNTRANLKEKR